MCALWEYLFAQGLSGPKQFRRWFFLKLRRCRSVRRFWENSGTCRTGFKLSGESTGRFCRFGVLAGRFWVGKGLRPCSQLTG